MKSHPFINSNPSGFDSDCATCGGKHRDAIHTATIQDAMAEILAALGFDAMSQDVRALSVQTDRELLCRYARICVKQSPATHKQELLSRFQLLNLI